MRNALLASLLVAMLPVTAFAGGRYHDHRNYDRGSRYSHGGHGHGHGHSGFAVNVGFSGGSYGSGYYGSFGYGSNHGYGGYVGYSNYDCGSRYYGGGYSGGYASYQRPVVVYERYAAPVYQTYSNCAPRAYYYSEPSCGSRYAYSGGYYYGR